jgi:hypothetical protein
MNRQDGSLDTPSSLGERQRWAIYLGVTFLHRPRRNEKLTANRKWPLEDRMDIYQEAIGMLLAFVAGGVVAYYWEMLKMRF